MAADPFAGILDPFAFWNISATYNRYSAFFDLVIYCSIFIAVTHAVLSHRFVGRPGKALSTAIGLALGISFTLLQRQFGWNLGQAAPIAVVIILFLVGALILHLLVKLGMSWKLAVPLSYVIVYLYLRAMATAIGAWIKAKVPFVNLLSAIVFLICVWQLGVALWPSSWGSREPRGQSEFPAGMNRKDERHELRVEKRIKRRLTPAAERQTAGIQSRLKTILKDLNNEKPDWESVSGALSGIAHDSENVVALIERIRLLDQRLEAFDLREFKELRGYYQQLPEEDRAELKEQIMFERKKIIEEHEILQLAGRCEVRHRDFRHLVDQAAAAVAKRDRIAASRHVSSAIALVNQQSADITQLRRAEKRLLHLTRKKLRTEASSR